MQNENILDFTVYMLYVYCLLYDYQSCIYTRVQWIKHKIYIYPIILTGVHPVASYKLRLWLPIHVYTSIHSWFWLGSSKFVFLMNKKTPSCSWYFKILSKYLYMSIKLNILWLYCWCLWGASCQVVHKIIYNIYSIYNFVRVSKKHSSCWVLVFTKRVVNLVYNISVHFMLFCLSNITLGYSTIVNQIYLLWKLLLVYTLQSTVLLECVQLKSWFLTLLIFLSFTDLNRVPQE
jgi:hypothetical protein